MKALKECELGESLDFESLLIWHMVIRELVAWTWIWRRMLL